MNPTSNREGVLSREGDRRRSPLLTVCVLLATSALSLVGFVYHGVLDALEREPGVLARDEWWRLLTPSWCTTAVGHTWLQTPPPSLSSASRWSVRSAGASGWRCTWLVASRASSPATPGSPEVPATPWRCAGWRAGFSPRS